MRYIVYGAGAIGGAIGAHLHLAGMDVTLVARGAHLAAIRRDGLVLDRAQGREAVPVPAVGGAAEAQWDGDTVVLLCVKGHQTAAALDDLAAHAPAETVVVSAQNGIDNEQAILRLFEATYGICVMLPATHLEPGVVVQKCHPTPGILDLGRVPDGTDATAEAVAADLRAAGFESVPRPDIMAWKRRKLLMNLGNAVDAACTPGDAADELQDLARAEGDRVYAEAGLACVSSAEDRERRGDILRRRDDLQIPLGGSTFQSLSRGTTTEVDHLNGEIVLLGRLHGVPTPANALLQKTFRDLARDGAPPRSVDASDLLSRLR
ncbi:MAG TPA: 2-dehydropantoate 2-reductase [Nocardioides sp.]|nr:2-dehydropantoate 2-reductase [Nocardioides sp.]